MGYLDIMCLFITSGHTFKDLTFYYSILLSIGTCKSLNYGSCVAVKGLNVE